MARLGPYGTVPRLAVAASGGADSTALALLAHNWAAARNGTVLALIVDHGLRADSAAEASLTLSRLAAHGIQGKILTLSGLSGAALQEKARNARFKALAQAALAARRLHLLLGHHAADQQETVVMRLARGPQGAEGIAAWAARNNAVLLRPLLGIQPAALRAWLSAQKMQWVDDPSNQSEKFERVRVRVAQSTANPASPEARQARELEAAQYLARYASIRPEGFAVLDADMAPTEALAALIRVIGGRQYAPNRRAVAALSAKLRPATLGGVRISAPSRLGGWLLTREAAAMAQPVLARDAAIWDRRFVLQGPAPENHSFGALGTDASAFRGFNGLPATVLRTMPCLRSSGGAITFPAPVIFSPPAPATSHPFSA